MEMVFARLLQLEFSSWIFVRHSLNFSFSYFPLTFFLVYLTSLSSTLSTILKHFLMEILHKTETSMPLSSMRLQLFYLFTFFLCAWCFTKSLLVYSSFGYVDLYFNWTRQFFESWSIAGITSHFSFYFLIFISFVRLFTLPSSYSFCVCADIYPAPPGNSKRLVLKRFCFFPLSILCVGWYLIFQIFFFRSK